MKAKANLKSGWKEWLKVIIIAVLGILCGAGVDLAVRPTTTEEVVEIEANTTLELSQEQQEATVTDENGNEQTVDVPTVEAVDGGQLADECPEGEEECGQGRYVYAPTDTALNFKNYTYGGCWDVDGAYGAQCWDLGALFWMNYTSNGRSLSTCGTGAAYGAWNCKEQNAGDDFELIYDATQLQAGDWVIFGGGQYGHVGMALGGYNNGYVALYGQNQGGKACEGGGSSANVINISTKNFLGAFRPKSYIKVEPTPEPAIPVTGCVEWGVQKGDTMSKIMLDCEGTVVYGEAMNAYADSWVSRIVKPGQTVLEGWKSASGVGLYAGDWIDHNTEGK